MNEFLNYLKNGKTFSTKLSDCDLSNQGKLKNPLQNKGDYNEIVEFSSK
jgi:hypothetical protein